MLYKWVKEALKTNQPKILLYEKSFKFKVWRVMETSSIWEKKCYEKISFDAIEDKESPYYIHYLGDTSLAMKMKKERKRKNAILEGGIVVAGAAFGIVSSLFTIASAAYIAGKTYHKSCNEDEKRRIEMRFSEIFPLKEIGYIGVGRRERWMDSPEKLNIFDVGAAGHIVEGIARGFSYVGDEVAAVRDKDMDLKNNLYIVGGPVTNAYSRNVIYGDEVQIPYKFRLDLNQSLAKTSPLELKNERYDNEPNWYICDEEGNEIKVCDEEGKEVNLGKPKIEHGILKEDSFMIIKCKNINPNANNNTKSIIFAGCHGPGTSAAGELIKNKEIIDYIYSKVRDEDFQLIGKVPVKRTLIEGGVYYEPGEITKVNIIDIRHPL